MLSNLLHMYEYGFEYSTSGDTAATGVMFLIWGITICFILIVYLVAGFSMFKIAKRLEDPSPWWAWVPVLNMMQILRLGEQSEYLALAIFVPCIGSLIVVVIAAMAWMKILEKLGKPSWHIIFVIFLSPWYMLYLALTEK